MGNAERGSRRERMQNGGNRGMNVPDMQTAGAIGAMVVAVYGIGAKLVGSYMRQSDRQAILMESMVKQQQGLMETTVKEIGATLKVIRENGLEHDNQSALAHGKICASFEGM